VVLRRSARLLLAAACALALGTFLSACGGTTYVDTEVGGKQPLDGTGWQRIEPIELDLPHLDQVRDDQPRNLLPIHPDTPTIVNIWASFCEPCKDELPLLQQVSRSRQFVVVGYTRDRVKADARKALDATGVGFLNYLDPDAEVALAMDGRVPINGIPSSILVRDGNAIAVHIGPFPDKATILAALEIR